MNNKSIIWREEAVAAIAASYSPHAERAKEVIMDAQLAVMALEEANIHAELQGAYNRGVADAEDMVNRTGLFYWHPYPEEKPEKNGRYLVWFETDMWMGTDYWDGHWNGHEGSCKHEFTDVIAWAEVPEYRRQSDGSD